MNSISDDYQQDLIPGYLIEDLVFEKDSTRVYRAKRLSDGMSVMLKSVTGESGARGVDASLRNEFEIANQLCTSGVIQVYGLEKDQQHPIVVLEDFGGTSLDNFLMNGPLPLETVLSIGVQVAQGLAAIHAANIIHKDINPSNIVFNPVTGQAKIIDFGISTFLTREQAALTDPQVVEGSLPYVSPEQTGRMNRSIDYRSDFYSFGVTLFELLTGALPFRANDTIEWFHCHIAKQPCSPRDIKPDIPQVVSDIVMKLMAKMAEDRYQSAIGVKVDLQQCLDQWRQCGHIEPFELGRDDVSQRFQTPQRLYGREQETAQLLESFARVAAGGNELVLVAGYSGIGKTCLIREIYRPVTKQRGFFVTGKFDQLQRNVPYSAVSAALRDLVRQLLTQSEEQLQRWRESIQAALGNNGGILVELVRELEWVIGPQPAVEPLPVLESNQRFFHVFLSFIKLFAQAEHPLVIFLDDVQWADVASLNLIELMMAPQSRLSYLLLITAYRDNEIQPGHLLLQSIKRIREEGCQIDEICLRPLQLHHLEQMLMDSLHTDRDSVQTLAALLQEKTAGNPFFTEEFLKALYQQGLLTFQSDERRWHWDMDAIRAQRMTDNVVALMTERLNLLVPETLELVTLAACIGNRFSLQVLAVVSELTLLQTEQRLRAAMTSGFVAPIGQTFRLRELDDADGAAFAMECAFAHDRIQQAAYALLDRERREQAHLQIGRLLLKGLTEEQLTERLFDIVNHFNLALERIDSFEERANLRQLNLNAGKRAKASNAYQAAYFYLATSLRLMSDDAWQADYEQTLEIYVEAAEAAYLSGDFTSMESLLKVGFEGARNLLDKVGLYQVQASALIAQGRLKECLDLIKPVMARLGHRYPVNPTRWHVALEMMKCLWTLRRVDMAALADQREMTDPRHLAANALGARIGAPAMFVQPELLSMMALRSVRIQYRHGHSMLGLNAWAVYGMVLASRLFKVEQGVAFAKLSLSLVERFRSRQMMPRARHIFNAMVRHWQEPVRNCIEPLQDVYRLALESGDYEYAVLALVIRMLDQLDSGMNLAQWQVELTETRAAVKQLRQGNTLDYVDIALQFHDNLIGKAPIPTRLQGEHYDIESKRKWHQDIGDKSLLVMDHDFSLWVLCLYGDYEGALREADTMSVDAANVGGFFMISRSYMLDSLIRLASITQTDRRQRKRLLRQVISNQKKLLGWARNNPANFHNKYCLVEAERLRVDGREFDAHAWYDKSIQAAAQQGFIHEQALASERCGLMHMAAGRHTLGHPYLSQALALYQQWGAHGKVNDLQQRFPQLINQAQQRRTLGTLKTTRTEQLVNIDITALMKALKAIAEERSHGVMIELILSAALEFAAAQRGLLLLKNAAGQLLIEGEAGVEAGQSRTLQSLPVDEQRLPLSLFNYVVRTQTSIVIHNAHEAVADIPGLHQDPYVLSHQVRSLLCMPVMLGSGEDRTLTGVLYLENNLANGVFTQERFDTLEIIIMSAAGRLELSRKASFDGLTGLFNHEYFQNMLRQEFAAARRYGQGLALLLIDIDHFKHFNDTWGHQVGDLVLREVAQLIKSNCRDCDIVARYGGEEMAVIMPSTTLPMARDVAERIRALVENHRIPHDEQVLSVTISMGMAVLDNAIADKDAMIRKADEMLYESKRNGRNQVTVAEPAF